MSREKPSTAILRNGSLFAERVGLPRRYFGDLYHFLLTTSWGQLVTCILIIYLLSNVFFAFLYWLGRNSIDGAHPKSFTDMFFFSVQTMATIGYGKLIPNTLFANILVTIEALFGLLGFALATGLMFAKFSRPTARVLFGKVAVISKRDGISSLMFRMANERGNQIVEAQLRIVLVQTETTVEGETIRRFYDLPLARDRNVIFTLTWTAIHPITKESPLFGATLESLTQKNASFIVSLVGIDETFSQTVHARYSYLPEEIVWGHRFVDILSRLPNGRVRVDYTRFHETQES